MVLDFRLRHWKCPKRPMWGEILFWIWRNKWEVLLYLVPLPSSLLSTLILNQGFQFWRQCWCCCFCWRWQGAARTRWACPRRWPCCSWSSRSSSPSRWCRRRRWSSGGRSCSWGHRVQGQSRCQRQEILLTRSFLAPLVPTLFSPTYQDSYQGSWARWQYLKYGL